jgi:hypothetical protein
MTQRRTPLQTFKRNKRERGVSALSSSLRVLVPAAIVLNVAMGRTRPAYCNYLTASRAGERLRAGDRLRFEGMGK